MDGEGDGGEEFLPGISSGKDVSTTHISESLIHPDQSAGKSSTNYCSGKQNHLWSQNVPHGNVHNNQTTYYVEQQTVIQSVPGPSDATRNSTRQTNSELAANLSKKRNDKAIKRFIDKVNSHTRRSIQGKLMNDYKDISEPTMQFFPQIKTGFQLFKGDYLPQEGFSVHCQPRKGEVITFQRLVEIVQQNDRTKPSVIIGQPGSGKTVLMKRLAKKCLQPVSFLKKIKSIVRPSGRAFDVVLHANVRDISNFEDVTPAEVLFCKAVSSLTYEEAHCGLEAITNGNIDIILIFDGLDQATWEPDSKETVGLWEKCNTATVFGNILTGHLLPGVPIVVSSREHSVASLPQKLRPDFVAALVGFTEHDAKSLFCELSGDGAAEDWDAMHLSNQDLLYMCLTPLFLIFYVIVRKVDLTNPPDCASGVMTRIIEILLESQHMRKEIADVVNKLKPMAFQGTKEQRVVFTREDLENFNLRFEEISDIVIKVAGINVLGQKLLEGMYRFFFSHQTLQEILSALFAVELELDAFKKFVDEECTKPYWSTVRTFTCGILQNEKVRNGIRRSIFNAGKLEDKKHYLIKSLLDQLKRSPTPAEKLDIFVALKEANSLSMLGSETDDLDFSNFPLTPNMTHVLCSVINRLDDVRLLSLANCGINDQLAEVIASNTCGYGNKITTLDIRENPDAKDSRLWERIFRNFSVKRLILDPPRNDREDVDSKLLTGIFVAAHSSNLQEIGMSPMETLEIDMEQAAKLNGTRFKLKINDLELLHFGKTLNSGDWKQLGILSRRCQTIVTRLYDYAHLLDFSALSEGYGNVKFNMLKVAWHAFYGVALKFVAVENREKDSRNFEKFINMDICSDLVEKQPRTLGRMIKIGQFDTVTFSFKYGDFDVNAFSSGLNGAKIKTLAIGKLRIDKLIEIVSQCHVEEVAVLRRQDQPDASALSQFTTVNYLTYREWLAKFW